MPEFAPGEAKVARAPITAKPSGLSCEVEVFLGPDDMTKVVTSGLVPFISTGVSQDVSLPVTMPLTEGSYHVYIDVCANGVRFLAYKAIEDVVIVAAVVSKFGYYITRCTSPWDPTGSYCLYDIECDVVNEGTARETRTIELWQFGATDLSYWHKLNQVEVTLDPGETYHYRFYGGYLTGFYPAGYTIDVMVTDNYYQWRWWDDKRRPYKGDSAYCSFTPGEAGWG